MPDEHSTPLPVTTSLPPQFEEVEEGLYREVLQLLNKVEVPYAISGAFALHHHTGIWRATKDLDLFITPDDVPRALHSLQADGFNCEVCDTVWLAKARRGDFFVDLITGMSNAVLTVDESWIERAQPAVVVGVSTRVLGAEELLASKLFVTRRERFDGADIAHVIYGTKGRLDWDRVKELAGENWEILFWALVLFRYVYPAQTSYVPSHVWDDLVGRFIAEIKNDNSKARFRGSLIDDKMFAVDVQEWAMDDLLSEFRARRSPKIPNLPTEFAVEQKKAS